MAGAKEGALAFMPSSNDSLSAPVNGNRMPHHISLPSSLSPSAARLSDELSVTNDLPNESAVLSPPSALGRSDDSASPTDMSTLPIRRFVSSASSLPSSDVRPASDQSFWHDHYQRAVEVHAKERALWEDERSFLEREVANLKQELKSRRSESSNSYFSNKDNDKIYPDADVIRQAQEKLRKLSNASIGRSNSNGGATSSQDRFFPQPASFTSTARRSSQDISPSQEASARGSATSFPPTTITGEQLTSISEDEAPGFDGSRRVSINDITTTITETPSITVPAEEQPPSPPTSAGIPTPPNARTYAGKTPPIPVAASNGSLHAMGVAVNHIHDAILEDDPELSSPKQLPSSPQNGNTDELSDLNKKLEQVAADPEANLPEVVRSAEATPDISSPNSSTIPQRGDGIGEVKLKTKRSLNFGVPLGAPLRDPRKM